MSVPAFSTRQIVLLVLLTLVWGLNWPVMKLGVTHFPPLSFRSLSMWLGLPVLYLAVRAMKVPLHIDRSQWRELGSLTITNMIVWHVLAVLSVQALSSGRAAILGYTMPVFSALWGVALFGQRLSSRQLLGVAAAALGVALLLWHEMSNLAGKPRVATNSARMGRPIHMLTMRKDRGGKCCTPSFITGQFRPQTMVSRIRRTSCLGVNEGMGVDYLPLSGCAASP